MAKKEYTKLELKMKLLAGLIGVEINKMEFNTVAEKDMFLKAVINNLKRKISKK
jgi:hypothetical protein